MCVTQIHCIELFLATDVIIVDVLFEFHAMFSQERSLASLQASLESMNASEQSLKAELGTALLSTLSSDDQHEVDRLNDEIQDLTSKNRHALEERVKV